MRQCIQKRWERRGVFSRSWPVFLALSCGPVPRSATKGLSDLWIKWSARDRQFLRGCRSPKRKGNYWRFVTIFPNNASEESLACSLILGGISTVCKISTMLINSSRLLFCLGEPDDPTNASWSTWDICLTLYSVKEIERQKKWQKGLDPLAELVELQPLILSRKRKRAFYLLVICYLEHNISSASFSETLNDNVLFIKSKSRRDQRIGFVMMLEVEGWTYVERNMGLERERRGEEWNFRVGSRRRVSLVKMFV
jgi:hypothetical protein